MSKIYVIVILVEYCMKLTFLSASKGSNYYKHVEKTYNFRIKSETGKSAIDYHLNGQLMISILIYKCPMSHGTMKYTLKAHVCYFVLIVGLLHCLYSLHADFYTSENIINIET